MRVALFFDGKNFYSGWRGAGRPRIAFPALASWLVKRAGGDFLAGAHYYTSVEQGDAAETPSQEALRAYLEMLELQPGYFVHRFPTQDASHTCPSCGTPTRHAEDREVDTTLVADVMGGAAVNAFDIAVLVSGDSDLAPAVEGMRRLGRQAYVATWGKAGLSRRLRQAAFDHIDLQEGVARFAERNPAPGGNGAESDGDGEARRSVPGAPAPRGADSPTDLVESFVREVRRAEETFEDGYVGLNYFLTRWKSDELSTAAEERRHLLDRAVSEGRVEIYDASDSAKALRVARVDVPCN